jgi:hypothetical protein
MIRPLNRLAAVVFLWRSARDSTVAPVLEPMLTAAGRYERVTAAKFLCEISRSPAALATLRRDLGAAGEEVFGALSVPKEPGPAAREAIPDVMRRPSSSDEEPRSTAGRALAAMQARGTLT